MLLRANCIKERQCESCDFTDECIVQRTMYSKFDTIKPKSITNGDSVGYVIECNDYRTSYNAGDELCFNLVLFGKNIVYFNQYLQAVYSLGQCGLGKNLSKFMVKQVLNTRMMPILDEYDVHMKYYQVETIKDYVEYRLKRLGNIDSCNIDITTPMTIKDHGMILSSFEVEPFLKAVYRRIYILNCFENNECEEHFDIRLPKLVNQELSRDSVRRYSFRKDEAMVLSGIKGRVELENIDKELLGILIAGEILHVGKNSSFGFGKYKIS